MTLAQPASLVAETPVTVTVARTELDQHVRQLHDGALQEVATLLVAVAAWTRAAEAGDLSTAGTMVGMLRDACDRLLADLHGLHATGRSWLDGVPAEDGGLSTRR